ncbi:MAG TPA: APC family permease [archaeon]|nr:APC family permease [archaeon]
MALERSVSLTQATIYGVGVILGAGIYALIGAAAGITGPALWISFIVAAIIASLTAFSYAELVARFPKSGAESVFVLKAFENERLAFFVGFVFLLSNLFSVATVSFGFATYFKLFFLISPMIVAIIVIILAAIINHLGIQESVFLNNLFTFIEVIGLILIIIFGFTSIGAVNLFEGINQETGFDLIAPIFSGVALVFFAFLGFEGIANISEEIKEPKKVVPKAILLSLVISTIIYVLVAMVSVSVVSPLVLSNASSTTDSTQGPLALVAEQTIMPGFGFWLSIIALFATFNTVLILLIVCSRYIYGLAEQKLLPKLFSKVNKKTKTPTNAIVASAVIAILFAGVGNLEILGNLTTAAIFLVFFLVNVSLISIRLKEKQQEKYLAPINFGKIPMLSVLGALFCAFILLTQYWQNTIIFGITLPLIIWSLLVYLLAFPIYEYFSRKKKANKFTYE